MKSIDIQITKATIEMFVVDLKGNLPEVSATIGLYSANDKRVSEFTIATQSWREPRFDLPATMIAPIMSISKQLEEIVTSECNKAMCLIPVVKEKK